MPIEDPIEPSLQSRLENEQLTRIIKECSDINILREIAIELLKLNQKKGAIAQWATKRAAESVTTFDIKKQYLITKDIDSNY